MTEADQGTSPRPVPATVHDPLGPDYRRLFSATVASNLGDGMSMVAYPWLASSITRNPILIALVMMMQRLPWLLFSLPAGVITDRVDRRRAMVAMDIVRGVVTVGVRVCRARGTGCSAGPRCCRLGQRHTFGVVPPRAVGDPAAGHGRSTPKQFGSDDHAQPRAPRPTGEGQRTDGAGVECHEHPDRATARIAAVAGRGSRCPSSSTPARSSSPQRSSLSSPAHSELSATYPHRGRRSDTSSARACGG